jgi:hypothetical protein
MNVGAQPVGMAPSSNPNPDVRIPRRCPSDFRLQPHFGGISFSVKVYLNLSNA